jgi:hypothetical protein
MNTLKFNKYPKCFCVLFSLSFFLASCSKESISVSKYEQDKQEIKKKLELAKRNPTNLGNRNGVVDSCDISGKNCLNFLHGLEIYVDISDCSTAVTDSCLVYADMEITICYDDEQNMEVNFKESIIGHSVDCIIQGRVIHTDDWDCIADKTYTAFIDYMMPIILELWGTNNDCEDGYNTALSSYSKELCSYPCTIQKGKFYYSKLILCGISSACCVKKDFWCKDVNGIIQSTSGGLYQVGECISGEVPCKPTKGPFPVLDKCRPRNCIQE